MANRRRNIHLHLMFTKDEKELLKTIADLKNKSMTDMILELVKKELMQRKEE